MIESISSTTARQIGSVKSAETNTISVASEPTAAEKISENRDEYVPSEEKEPIGLYSVSPDENDDPRVSFDGENKSGETVTANTDNVDRELKALRDKERALRQKLNSADENTSADIRRELDRVSAELVRKDNDQYRRQNTIFT